MGIYVRKHALAHIVAFQQAQAPVRRAPQTVHQFPNYESLPREQRRKLKDQPKG